MNIGGNNMTAEELENLVWDMKLKWTSKFKEGEYEEAWKVCMDTWRLLPEPKYKEPASWDIVPDIVKYSIETKNFEYADKFIGLLYICDLDRADSGEREFWAGRLAYAKGDMDIAKELLACSLEKSGGFGIITHKENRVYKEFAQGKGKSAKPKSKLSADKLIDKADKTFAKKKYEEAEELYLQGLDKIGELEDVDIRGQYYRNAYTGLGDCHFLKKEYDSAIDYFIKAYNYDVSNPYINLRIGECYVFLDNEPDAKEYLMRAYMVAGEDIFVGSEPFFDIIKEMI